MIWIKDRCAVSGNMAVYGSIIWQYGKYVFSEMLKCLVGVSSEFLH